MAIDAPTTKSRNAQPPTPITNPKVEERERARLARRPRTPRRGIEEEGGGWWGWGLEASRFASRLTHSRMPWHPSNLWMVEPLLLLLPPFFFFSFFLGVYYLGWVVVSRWMMRWTAQIARWWWGRRVELCLIGFYGRLNLVYGRGNVISGKDFRFAFIVRI